LGQVPAGKNDSTVPAQPISRSSGSSGNSGGGPDPASVVVAFLGALTEFDLDAALDLVTEDLEYVNVSLPTIRGRSGLDRAFRPLLRPDRFGFNVHLNHVATEGSVVLTDRIDEINFRRFASRFWVYGRWVVRDDQIAVWRDSFDWLDVTVANVRGLLGLLSPTLNRTMPEG
jgi:limonene-1,2-epoxide hydrolase